MRLHAKTDIGRIAAIWKYGLEPAIRCALYEGPVRLTYYPAPYRSRPLIAGRVDEDQAGN